MNKLIEWFKKRVAKIRDVIDRLSPRERRLVGLGIGCFCVLLFFVVGVLLVDRISGLEERNAEIRQSLTDMETHRDSYRKAKAKAQELEAKLGGGSFQLSSFVEQAAKESGVVIPESNERPPTTVGKKYTERSVDLRLQKVRLDVLGPFLKRIESGSNYAVVTALSIHTRDDRHRELDVDMTVTTYERAKKDKDKGKKEESP